MATVGLIPEAIHKYPQVSKGLVAKNDAFSIFWMVISRKPLDLHRGKFAQNFF